MNVRGIEDSGVKSIAGIFGFLPGVTCDEQEGHCGNRSLFGDALWGRCAMIRCRICDVGGIIVGGEAS
jgi:hypothetical protein